MEYREPDCFRCKFLKSLPKGIGGKATCVVYPNGIPKRIFFEAGNCSKKPNPTKKKRGVKSGSRKK